MNRQNYDFLLETEELLLLLNNNLEISSSRLYNDITYSSGKLGALGDFSELYRVTEEIGFQINTIMNDFSYKCIVLDDIEKNHWNNQIVNTSSIEFLPQSVTTINKETRFSNLNKKNKKAKNNIQNNIQSTEACCNKKKINIQNYLNKTKLIATSEKIKKIFELNGDSNSDDDNSIHDDIFDMMNNELKTKNAIKGVLIKKKPYNNRKIIIKEDESAEIQNMFINICERLISK